jgi:hypothetical protein
VSAPVNGVTIIFQSSELLIFGCANEQFFCLGKFLVSVLLLVFGGHLCQTGRILSQITALK